MKFVGRAVTRAAALAAGAFYRVEREGGELPDGPTIIVANHPNMLMDPLLVLRTTGCRVRALAKAPLFRIPVFGQVLRAMDTLPLYRVQDDPEQRARNRLAYQEAVEALRRGATLLMFPEGKSHSEPRLAPLKSGVARMALEAEDRSGWRLGVKIVPLGLAYEHKHRVRSRVRVGIGESVVVGEWRDTCGRDRAAAVRSLTDAVAGALATQVLNVSQVSDRRLIEIADLLYIRAKCGVGWRERETWSRRLPRLQNLADQFAWLRERDTERWNALSRSLREYEAELRLLGTGDAEVPPHYETKRVARFVWRELGPLLAGLPIAALGTTLWCVPHFMSAMVCRVLGPNIETVATVKLLTGIVFYSVAYLGWIVLAVAVGGLAAGIATAVAAPILGMATIHWWDRSIDAFEDVRLFLTVLRHPAVRHRIVERRGALVAELDSVTRLWTEATVPGKAEGR
jgi:1-acyl-sn-glycerol-3-phosphate acyltransferase